MYVLAFWKETKEIQKRGKTELEHTKQKKTQNEKKNLAAKQQQAVSSVLHAFFYSTNHSFNIRGRVRFILGITTLGQKVLPAALEAKL